MAPDAEDGKPVAKQLSPFPLHPSPRRTTSSTSTVTAEQRRLGDSPSSGNDAKLLHPATPRKHSRSATFGSAAVHGHSKLISSTSTPSSSRPSSVFEGFSPSKRASRPPSPSTSLLTVEAGLGGEPSRHGARSPDGSSNASSRKGKERALDPVEVDQMDVGGEMVVKSEDAREGLRVLVRRSTLVGHPRSAETGSRPLAASLQHGTKPDRPDPGDRSDTVDPHSFDPPVPSVADYSDRRYYILTNAGKPVFTSHNGIAGESISELMGIASALISIFAEDEDRLRSITRGRKRVAFLLKAPLYLFCVSNWGEPEHVLRTHLEYLHLQVLSVASSTQLAKAFQRRSNFDPSRLLDGTEQFLHNLIKRSQHDFSYLTSSLQPFRMAPALRETAAAALMPPTKLQDLLYVLLIADGRIVTLLRPRKHAIHPSDLHLLLNTLESSKTLRSSEAWIPICLPKFNPAGFVHAYVDFVCEEVGMVFVSADREAFEVLRSWKSTVVEKLQIDDTLNRINESIPDHPYSVSAIGCPGLRHFVYKSRQLVQVTMPLWEDPYEEGSVDQKRLITVYQHLHDALHARSGQAAPLKLVYTRSEHEACLAWLTKPFELYLATSPHLPKSAVVAAANSVAKWVLGEEGRLFLRDAPVF